MNANPIIQLPAGECRAPETKENPQLCWKCQALFNSHYPEHAVISETSETRREPKKKQIRQVQTLDSTESTARRGCTLCLQLFYSLNVAMRATLSKFVEPSGLVYKQYLFLREGHPPFLSLRIMPGHVTPISGSDEIKCSIQLYPTSEFELFVNHGTIERSTDSHSSWALVSRWLEGCMRNHKLCNPSPEITPALPCRVIDIGLDEHTRPRLLLVNDQTPLAQYATMSHCWGSYMPLQLSSHNISALENEIPVSHLSKSFQDCMAITRRLGLRYLWIDSLCIIQDSEEDWREQSASMARIYSNSYCNIAAAHAANGKYGCFIGRDPDLIKPLSIDLNWGPRQGTYYAVQWLYWSEKVLETPLNQRAWVCQERFLAPRNLYFGEKQVYWECCEVAASEQFPLKLPPTIMTSSAKGIIPHMDGARIRRERRMIADPTLDAFSVWDRIIGRYTTGQLTYQTDKLVALSGMAVEMYKYTKTQYLAGMWRKNLAYQLLWEVRGIQWVVGRSRPETYIAPSWSWASVNGHIENACNIWFPDNREILIEILDVKVETFSDDNPFGQVKGGFLRIRGSLAKAGVQIEESRLNRGSYRLSLNGVWVGDALLDVDSGEGEPSCRTDLYYLPIRYDPNRDNVVGREPLVLTPSIYGIILRPEVCKTQQTFTRVGRFDVFGSYKEFKSTCCEFSQGDPGAQSKGWGEKKEIVIL